MLNNFFHKTINFLKDYFVTIFLLIIFIATNYSIFHSSFFHVHDFTHAARIAEMARALDQGQFPVRWSENFGYGFGMPLFNFYAPLPYFIGAIFFKMGFDVVASIKILYLLISLVTLLGSYSLGRKLLGRWGGLLLATAYTLAPYRALNLFVRGAVSEAFAMAFLPLVIFAIVAFIKKQDKKYLLLLIVSIFSIILSHNLTALIFIPMAALFTFIYLLQQKKIKLIWPIAGSFLLSAALSFFYILPAFMEKDLTMINSIFSGYFHYSHHFLYIRQFFQDNWQYGGSAWGPNDDISFFLGKGQLLGLMSLIILICLNLFRNFKKIIKSNLFFLSIVFGFLALLSLVMSLMKSQILWDNFSILQYIQFPWRFLSAASFFVATLLAISIYFTRIGLYRSLYGTLILFLLLFNAVYFKPEKYLDDENALYYTDAAKIQNQMSETLPDYIPKQMAKQEVLLQINQKFPSIWTDSGSKNNLVEMTTDHGFEKLANADFREADVLNFKVANFAGWEAQVNGEKYPIDQNNSLGNIRISLPVGEHKVGIYFSENTVSRRVGDAISILALVIVFYFFYPFAKKKN